jgi:hypothetical protein
MLEDRMAGADIEAEQQQIAGHHLGEDLTQGEKAGRIHEPAETGDQIEAGDMGNPGPEVPAQDGKEFSLPSLPRSAHLAAHSGRRIAITSSSRCTLPKKALPRATPSALKPTAS